MSDPKSSSLSLLSFLSVHLMWTVKILLILKIHRLQRILAGKQSLSLVRNQPSFTQNIFLYFVISRFFSNKPIVFKIFFFYRRSLFLLPRSSCLSGWLSATCFICQWNIELTVNTRCSSLVLSAHVSLGWLLPQLHHQTQVNSFKK